jgi:flavin-dependent dehydrogenase
MGGILAGKSIASAIERKDDAELRRYQQEWSLLFREEFQKMLLARRLLERLDNKAIDEMFSAIPSDKLGEVSAVGDFDFHSIALTKLLGTRTAVRVAKAILGNEIRRLID